MDVVAEDLKLADELGLRSSVHIETGGSGGRPIDTLVEHGLLRDTTTFVHNNGISDDQLRMMADAGSSVSISPDVGRTHDGYRLAGDRRLLAAGLRPTLSTDDCPSASGDIFSAMRTASSGSAASTAV